MKDEEVEKDDSAVDIVKYGAYKEFAFFDEVRQLFISFPINFVQPYGDDAHIRGTFRMNFQIMSD